MPTRPKPRRPVPIRPKPIPGVPTPRIGPTPGVEPNVPRAEPLPTPIAVDPNAPPATGVVAEAEEIVKRIRSRKHAMRGEQWAQGRDLLELAKPERYEALGYRTFEQALKARDLYSRMTAYKYKSVAEAFSEETVKQRGADWAAAALGYAEAKRRDVAELMRENPKLVAIGKRFLEASVRELKRATKPAPRPDPARKKLAQNAAKTCGRALRRKGSRSVRVRAVEKDGRWLLQVEITPEEGLDVFR